MESSLTLDMVKLKLISYELGIIDNELLDQIKTDIETSNKKLIYVFNMLMFNTKDYTTEEINLWIINFINQVFKDYSQDEKEIFQKYYYYCINNNKWNNWSFSDIIDLQNYMNIEFEEEQIEARYCQAELRLIFLFAVTNNLEAMAQYKDEIPAQLEISNNEIDFRRLYSEQIRG